MREFISDNKTIKVGTGGILITTTGSKETKLFPIATLKLEIDWFPFGRHKVVLTNKDTLDTIKFLLDKSDIESLQNALIG